MCDDVPNTVQHKTYNDQQKTSGKQQVVALTCIFNDLESYLRNKTYVPVYLRGNKPWVRRRVRIN